MEENIIFTKFLNLKPEKRQRILNAAMKEFAQKGFKNASTDVIVKEAGISKGALFHYFNNKKDLFLFLYDYTMDVLMNEMLPKFDFNEKDVFNRILQGSRLKLEILKMYPEMYNFILTAYMEESREVKSELEKRNKGFVATGYNLLSEGIDYTRFKDGVDGKRAADIIFWTMEGYTNKELAKVRTFALYELNIDELLKEVEIYLDMLKKSFYK